MQPYNARWSWAEIDSFVGHALGLEFYMPADKQTIMYPDLENAIYNTVQYCDNEAFLNLY